MDWSRTTTASATSAGAGHEVRQVGRPRGVRARVRRAARPRRRARRPRAPSSSASRSTTWSPWARASTRRPEYADAFFHKSLFVGGSTRDAVKEGRGDYIPVFFHEIPKLFCEGYLPPDVVAHPRVAARQARLLLVRHLGRLHQAGGPGGEDRRRPGQPQDAAHARRLVHPRLRDRLHRRERAGRSSSCSRRGSARRGGHRQAHRRARRGRLLPAARHRRHPRRGAPLPAREERPRHPQRDVQRGRRRPLQRGRHHQPQQDDQPRQDGRPPSSWARAASTTSSTTTRPSTCSR